MRVVILQLILVKKRIKYSKCYDVNLYHASCNHALLTNINNQQLLLDHFDIYIPSSISKKCM